MASMLCRTLRFTVMLSGYTSRVPSFQPPPLPQLLPLCSPSIAPLAGKFAFTVEDATAVAPYEASATFVGQGGGQLEVLVNQFEKSTRVLTRSPLPGPTGPGPLAAPHQLACALTVAGPSFCMPKPLPAMLLLCAIRPLVASVLR